MTAVGRPLLQSALSAAAFSRNLSLAAARNAVQILLPESKWHYMKSNRRLSFNRQWDALVPESRFLKPRNQAPMLYKVAKHLIRNNVRGSFQLLLALKKIGILDRPVNFILSDSIRIQVPIARSPWDASDLSRYEAKYMVTLGKLIAHLREPVTLIDGGADIGLFSLKTLTLCPAIRRIIAFEPNPEGLFWLQRNLSQLAFRSTVLPKALSNFEGWGKLEVPLPGTEQAADLATDYAARYLVPAVDGPIPVTTIDSLSLPSGASLIVKLDLEGGELAALRGSIHTIRSASSLVVAIEAHPLVTKRMGIDPVESLRLLQSLRPFSFVAAETGTPIDLARPVFSQLPFGIYNLLAYSI